jgi:hypothetical protein
MVEAEIGRRVSGSSSRSSMATASRFLRRQVDVKAKALTKAVDGKQVRIETVVTVDVMVVNVVVDKNVNGAVELDVGNSGINGKLPNKLKRLCGRLRRSICCRSLSSLMILF